MSVFFHLRDMAPEHHEALFRDLFRALQIAQAAGNESAASLNREYIELILAAKRISNERRLEIEIEVVATLAVTEMRSHPKKAAA